MRGFPPFRPGVSEFTYQERGQVPNMRGFTPLRPGVSEFTSRANVSSDSYHAHINRYNFDTNNLNAEHIDRPLYLVSRDRYGGRKYGI